MLFYLAFYHIIYFWIYTFKYRAPVTHSDFCSDSVQIKSVQELSGQICQICNDEIEVTVDGEPFVACNECAFPVCRPCYEYERREGNKACPQCKTRYKRIKGEIIVEFLFHFCNYIYYRQSLTNEWIAGSPRVEGDEDEDDIDDLDNEFDYGDPDALGPHPMSESMLSGRMQTGRGSNSNASGIPANMEHESSLNSEIPLLTYGEEVNLKFWNVMFFVQSVHSCTPVIDDCYMIPFFFLIGLWDIFWSACFDSSPIYESWK